MPLSSHCQFQTIEKVLSIRSLRKAKSIFEYTNFVAKREESQPASHTSILAACLLAAAEWEKGKSSHTANKLRQAEEKRKSIISLLQEK